MTDAFNARKRAVTWLSRLSDAEEPEWIRNQSNSLRPDWITYCVYPGDISKMIVAVERLLKQGVRSYFRGHTNKSDCLVNVICINFDLPEMEEDPELCEQIPSLEEERREP